MDEHKSTQAIQAIKMDRSTSELRVEARCAIQPYIQGPCIAIRNGESLLCAALGYPNKYCEFMDDHQYSSKSAELTAALEVIINHGNAGLLLHWYRRQSNE